MKLVASVCVVLSLCAGAGEIVFDYDMVYGGFEITSCGGAEALSCIEGVVGFEEYQPNLPVVSRCFVIPQGSTVTGADFEILSETALEGFHDVLPVRVTALGAVPAQFQRNPFVYLSDDPFPVDQVVSVFTGTRTGFRLGSVSFSPFRYNPLSGRLAVVTEARVTLHFEQEPSLDRISLSRDQVEHAASILVHIVQNPESLEFCSPPLHPVNDDWPVWVAIGASSLESVVQPLVDFRSSMGLTAEFVSLEWIYENYAGYDTQEQIRNYLADSYENRGLVYALLIGDWGETQRISSLMVGGDSLVLNETTDLYFSDLTRFWDGDGDHLYGENTDWIDYYSDISVGRFSSDVPAHIQTMVEKAIGYETQSLEGSWRTSALLCGAGLWPDVEPDGYWGSFVCDSIASRIPGGWTVHKLYETFAGHPTNQIAIINQGVSYVSDQGHGGSSGVYWLYEPGNMFTNQNYTGMTNSGMLTIFHSMACDPGQLSVNGCSAERLMMWPDGGAVAVMYNSYYGWGTPPSMGPSEYLELHFADMMFVSGVERIGDMQAAAKDAFKAAGGMTLQNWVLQENNMLGDPAALFLSYQTGIEEGGPSGEAGVLLGPASPNPAHGSFSVIWGLASPSAFSISLYDLSGRLLFSEEKPAGAGTSGVMTLSGLDGDGNPLPPGCYLVSLESTAGSASTRIVLLGE